MTTQPASPLHWPMDDRWLEELDALLPIETATSFAPFQAAAQPPVPSTSPATPQTSNASEDGDGERMLVPGTSDRRREYRQKKRNELMKLRGMSSQLQAQLYELMRRREALVETANGSKRLTAGWRGVALRQMQRRLAAEALNRELRMHIRTRHEATVSLMETLRVQMSMMGSTRATGMADENWSKPVMQLSEKDVWDLSLLVHEVDEMCAHASAELQRANMPQLEADKTYNSRYSRDFIETSGVHTAALAESIAVPFSFSESNSAMEKGYPVMIGSECVPAIMDIAEDGSTAAVKYLCGPFEVLSVSKAIEGNHRSDLAWRSIVRERGEPTGHYITEYGWGCVVPANELATSTRVHFLSHWRAEHSQSPHAGMVAPSVPPLDRYTHMLIESSEIDTAKFVHTLENAIVDELVTQKQGSIDVLGDQGLSPGRLL